MLIEFSVANYRSFLGRQTLSMVAGPIRDNSSQHALETGIKAVPRLLQSAAVYGPNAAGKSNLIKALAFFKEFVINSAKQTQEGEKIDVAPFKLTKKSGRQPSEFEIIFIENGSRYQYGFTADSKRIWEEWLFVVPPGGRTQRWFERTYNSETASYDWRINPSIKGKREVWKESTRDNALFLSTAVQLKSEPLQEPFSWFQERLAVLTSLQRPLPTFTARQCHDGEWKDKILAFLKAADLGISDIVIKILADFSLADILDINMDDIPALRDEVTSGDIPDKLVEKTEKQWQGKEILKIFTKHKDNDGDDILFSMNDESDGTNVLFSLAGPWLDVLENGRILVVDELNNSLHPHMLRFLVGLIHDKERNQKNAQLVFTTHDTSILSGDFMGRDQVWLVEKDQQQATELYPLLDFKPRKGEALEKGYLGGRYGALPKIKELT